MTNEKIDFNHWILEDSEFSEALKKLVMSHIDANIKLQEFCVKNSCFIDKKNYSLTKINGVKK